ncbi:hypothetical protein PT974_07673 [Cladobotryum mycophilum]|uniref:Uncharacterized protein n=1 Tax=Cladobotryum mycophilum TaxID=491253 RepID=A0ABR0SR81_9HYPO
MGCNSESTDPLLQPSCDEEDGTDLNWSDKQHKDTPHEQKVWRITTSTCLILIGVFLAQLVAVFVLALALEKNPINSSSGLSPARSQDSPPSTFHRSHCGNSTEEALERNCHFDVFSFGWHPLECFDEELYTDFIKRHQHVLYWETTDGKPVDVASVMRGEHGFVVTTWEFHLVHCLYAWEKTTRSVLRGSPLDEWSPRYGHTRHCVHELMNQDRYPMKEIMTSAKRWYPACGLSERNLATLLGDHSSGHNDM